MKALPVVPGRRVAGLGKPWTLVVDGDSNTDPAYAPIQPWWTQLGEMLADYPVTLGSNFATAGSQWTHLTSRQAAVNASNPGGFRCLLLMCGTNDIQTAGLDGAGALLRAASYLASATGWDAKGLIWIPPLSVDQTRDSYVNAYNQGLSSVPGVSFVVSRAGVFELSNSLNLAYFADSVHMNPAGRTVQAMLVKQALELFL